ncbi:MAG: tRNA pseudouridine(38-40) synthase TruA [Planctomycetota bacterium]|nr:MAG: tRNA pseudouridine(38-40) synthase TruA [Planctomycetota bacterium]
MFDFHGRVVYNAEMRKYKVIVEYDGTNYFGWQYQKDVPTVQEELSRAIRRITGEDPQVLGAGRTDRGVHALGQVATFLTSRKLPERNWVLAINRYLPPDISVRHIEPVENEFNVIKDAVSKVYCYTILNQEWRSAFWHRRAWWVQKRLDLEKMRAAGGYLVGKYDFSSFETANSPRCSSVRTIFHLEVREIFEVGRLIQIWVEADGFLYNMVRNIAGTLVEVGLGKILVERVPYILQRRDRRLAGPTAPPQGLCMIEVKYSRS